MATEPNCPVTGCGTDPNLLIGGPPMKCGGYGSTDSRCMANWSSIDPKDAGTYTQYLAHEAGECGEDCPYTVVHDSNLHRSGECDPETCFFPHRPEEGS